jgi:hypothetical protein
MPKAGKSGPRPRVTWDIKRLLADAGGADALVVSHADFGFPPLTVTQVRNWRTRHTIPSERLAEILIAMRALCGPGIDVFDYLKIAGQQR